MHLPETQDAATQIANHRQRLAETIANTADWRLEKADESAANPVLQRRNAKSAQALLLLSDFITDLPDDDPELRLTFRGMAKPGDERGSTYYLLEGQLKTLGRYGLHLDDFPDEESHRKVLRDLGAIGLQARKEGSNHEAERLLKEIYKRVRRLRFIQDDADDELAGEIERLLEAIWDGDDPLGE